MMSLVQASENTQIEGGTFGLSNNALYTMAVAVRRDSTCPEGCRLLVRAKSNPHLLRVEGHVISIDPYRADLRRPVWVELSFELGGIELKNPYIVWLKGDKRLHGEKPHWVKEIQVPEKNRLVMTVHNDFEDREEARFGFVIKKKQALALFHEGIHLLDPTVVNNPVPPPGHPCPPKHCE